MAKATVEVEVLVDDLDGSEAGETVRLGWNGDWREIDLSKKNMASLAKALNKYWDVGRPVTNDAPPTDRPQRRASPRKATSTRSTKAAPKRDPKKIRVWATENDIPVPARGRIPGDVEQRYNEANGRS